MDQEGAQTSVKGGDFELSIVMDGKQKEIYMLNGTPNIIADIGKEYKVKVENNSDEEIKCSLSVDGVDAMGTNMILPPCSHYCFKGFRSPSGLSAFVFSPLKQVPTNSSSKSPSHQNVPDINIGLIQLNVWACKRLGLNSTSSPSHTTVSGKDLSKIKADSKKCAIATGTGSLLQDSTVTSKYNYETGNLLQTLEIRYNGIGGKVEKGQLDEAFNVMDYE